MASEENSINSPSNGPPTPPLPKSTAAASLFEHVRVNSIGDYYNIDRLVSLANTKIKHLLRSDSEDQSWVVSLPTAIEAAVGSTGDDELLGILASAAASNISTLLELDQFKSLGVVTDFSIKVLQGCAREMLQLSEVKKRSSSEIELQKGQIQDSKSEISALKGCLAVLKKTSWCRNSNCDAEFQCFIDSDECLLRCAKCRCKHYS